MAAWTNKDELQDLVNRNWFSQLSDQFPDQIDFAEALVGVAPSPEILYGPSYAYAFGIAQSVIRELLSEIRRLKVPKK